MRQTDLLKRYISVGFMLLILVGCQSTSTSTPTSLPPTEPSVSQIFQRCNQSGHNTACYVSGDAGTIVVQGTKARFNTPGDTINLSGITSLILNSASDAVAIRVQPVGSPEAVQQDLAVILFGNVEMHDMALAVGTNSFDFKLRTTTSQLCLYTTYKYAGSSNRQSSLVNTSFASHRLQTSHAPPIIPISTLFPFQNRATQSPLLSPFLELTPTPRFSPRVVRTPLPFQNRATQSPLLSPFLELTPTPRFSPRVVRTPLWFLNLATPTSRFSPFPFSTPSGSRPTQPVKTECQYIDSGVLLQRPDSGQATAIVEVNGVKITLGSTIYSKIRSSWMSINTLEGSPTVAASGQSRMVNAGNGVHVPLDGSLQANGPPTLPEPYLLKNSFDLLEPILSNLPVPISQANIVVTDEVAPETSLKPQVVIPRQPWDIDPLTGKTYQEELSDGILPKDGLVPKLGDIDPLTGKTYQEEGAGEFIEPGG